jgi:hypothetical protein
MANRRSAADAVGFSKPIGEDVARTSAALRETCKGTGGSLDSLISFCEVL